MSVVKNVCKKQETVLLPFDSKLMLIKIVKDHSDRDSNEGFLSMETILERPRTVRSTSSFLESS